MNRHLNQIVQLADRNQFLPAWAGDQVAGVKFNRDNTEIPRYADIESRFKLEAQSLVQGFIGKQIDRKELLTRFKSKLYQAETEAFIAGKRAAGKPVYFVTPGEQRMLVGRHSRNMRYFNRFVRDMETSRGRIPYVQRAGLYANSLWSIYNRGQSDKDWDEEIAPNVRYVWVMDPDAEHCVIAGSLVRTASDSQKIETANGAAFDTSSGVSLTGGVASRGLRDSVLVSTTHGYQLGCTPDHRCQIVRAGSSDIEWVRADQIKAGDLAVMKRGTASVELYNDEAWLAGMIAGDGWINSTVGLTLDSRDFALTEAGIAAYRRHIRQAAPVRPHGTGPCVKMVTASKSARAWVASWGDIKNEVPSRAYTDGLGSYLRGLFDADGSVNKNQVTLSTVKETLARSVQQALFHLGIISKVRSFTRNTNYKDNSTIWTVRVSGGQNLRLFVKYVGFTGVKAGRIRLHECDYTKDDVYPRSIGGRTGYWALRDLSSKNWSRASVASRSNKLIIEDWISRGYFFAEVEDVISIGLRETYDVINSPDETFIANGFVVHNCDDCIERWRQSRESGGFTWDELVQIGFPGEGTRCQVNCRCHVRPVVKKRLQQPRIDQAVEQDEASAGVQLLQAILGGSNMPIRVPAAGLPEVRVSPVSVSDSIISAGSRAKELAKRIPESIQVMVKPVKVYDGYDIKTYVGSGMAAQVKRDPDNGTWGLVGVFLLDEDGTPVGNSYYIPWLAGVKDDI